MDPYVYELQKAMEVVDDHFRCDAESRNDEYIYPEGETPQPMRCILRRGHDGMHVNEGMWMFE